MRVLIALGEQYFPQQGGGSQGNARELAIELQRRGIYTAISCKLRRKTTFGAFSSLRMALARRPYDDADYDGTRVIRLPRPSAQIDFALEAVKADVVLLHGMSAMPMAHRLSDIGVPLVVYWHDVEIARMEGNPIGLKARYLANSNFTASFYESHFHIQSVVAPPLIVKERYDARSQSREAVVFIGSGPEKGLDVALSVAALAPSIPFMFVESWLLNKADRSELIRRVRALPNAQFIPHQSDMLPIYQKARVVLAPSQWQEAWGRIASEAHINGIPVLASKIGGLPEAVGPGGILLDPHAPAEKWALTLQRLWNDQETYRHLSSAALHYSGRRQLQVTTILDQIVATLNGAISDRKPA